MKIMQSQVTTKRGDEGNTVTLGGDTHSKCHPILECTGQLDTLRARTALCRLAVLESDVDCREELAESLLWLLHIFFLMGSQCNDPLNKHPEYRKMDVSEKHLHQLEEAQTKIEQRVRIPERFIVCASNRLAAEFDIACTQARAFERAVVALKEAVPEFDASVILAFVNRLSDYLFITARMFENGSHMVVDYDLLSD